MCDSHVRPATLVRLCDDCHRGSAAGRCLVCGHAGFSDARYCQRCVATERDRDGCPRIVNLGGSRIDQVYQKKAGKGR